MLVSKGLARTGAEEGSIKLTLEIYSPLRLSAQEDKEQHCDNEVSAWLRDVVGLPQYIGMFAAQGFDTLDIVKLVNEDDLMRRFKIAKLGHLLKLCSEIRSLHIED